MEELCIVKRRRPDVQMGFGAAEGLNQGAVGGPKHEGGTTSSRPSLAHVYPLRGDIRESDEQKLTIELTPTQANVVNSHAYFKPLLGTDADGSSVGVQRSEDGEIVFNFYFKQVYLLKMLTSSDVCHMLQVSRSFLTRLVRDGRLKSYRIGRLRRFSLEDILTHLSEGREVLVKGEDHVL